MRATTPTRLNPLSLLVLALAPALVHAQFEPLPVQSVRKLSDGELGCGQIYTESQTLEKALLAWQAEAAQAQQAMDDTQNEMLHRAQDARGGGLGAAIGGGLLGLVPGGGQVAGYAAQAAASARRAGMQESANRMVQAQGRLMKLEQAMEHAQARSEHLADLFLKKGCRLSEVKAAADPAQ
ncbi:MAG: hypothetical protein IBJ14_14415 [Hydrogenophaga sp.]|nr:hypothetical protein [Hydrogenophaga sp.]